MILLEKLTAEQKTMADSNVLWLSETTDTMTFPQCLAFIGRSRRQLDRLEHLPRKNEPAVDPEEIASIRSDLAALEKSIRSNPSCPA